ncbi:MAG: sensor histidine kinase, partial [Anaerolineales bacterium]|nr:sensor histidine kinase [Anaerolineales bacterium]
HSVLSQLLDNALKYAPEGPIWVEADLIRSRVRVRVTDCGPGIPVEKRPFLFERFQRLHASDSQTVYGYGLGLYLARQLLRAHKSDLRYEAPPEGGSRFVFFLQAVQ